MYKYKQKQVSNQMARQRPLPPPIFYIQTHSAHAFWAVYIVERLPPSRRAQIYLHNSVQLIAKYDLLQRRRWMVIQLNVCIYFNELS